MTPGMAEQVAALLNAENRLAVHYTADRVLARAERFILCSNWDILIGCIEVERVQWYQCEISHLCVVPDRRRQGFGETLMSLAEHQAMTLGARIAQATIRADNEPSIALFAKRGYRTIAGFHNATSGREIAVYQKDLT